MISLFSAIARVPRRLNFRDRRSCPEEPQSRPLLKRWKLGERRASISRQHFGSRALLPHRPRWRKSPRQWGRERTFLARKSNGEMARWACRGAPPWCSTAKIRRFGKRLILKDFFVTENRWRRGRDSNPR